MAAQMITTVLVPTDGSGHAVKAVSLAADIASKYGASVVLLHSYLARIAAHEVLKLIESGQLSDETRADLEKLSKLHEKIHAATSMAPSTIPASSDLLEKIGKEVLDAAEAVARERGVEKVDKILTDGEPVQRILGAAADAGADLIVMGSRGLGGLQGLLVGSVSHKVSHLAECTVITVK